MKKIALGFIFLVIIVLGSLYIYKQKTESYGVPVPDLSKQEAVIVATSLPKVDDPEKLINDQDAFLKAEEQAFKAFTAKYLASEEGKASFSPRFGKKFMQTVNIELVMSRGLTAIRDLDMVTRHDILRKNQVIPFFKKIINVVLEELKEEQE